MAKDKRKTVTDGANEPEPTTEFKTQGTIDREQIVKRERPKGEVLASGAEFWDFEKEPVFIGTYVRDVIRERDGKNAATVPNEKAGSVMGYMFKDQNGFEHIIGNSHAIEKVLKDPKNKTKELWIEWEGKSELDGGRTFNRFHIQTVD